MEYKVRDEFEKIKDLAARIRAKFDYKAKANELLQDCQLLNVVFILVEKRTFSTGVKRL